jgi:hypothetical protein
VRLGSLNGIRNARALIGIVVVVVFTILFLVPLGGSPTFVMLVAGFVVHVGLLACSSMVFFLLGVLATLIFELGRLAVWFRASS